MITGFIAAGGPQCLLLIKTGPRSVKTALLSGNTLHAGSEFKGYIDPSRCDLSRDGDRFVYYAIGRDQRRYQGKTYKYWTVLCRPPRLSAMILFPHFTRNYGGGFFDEAGVLHVSADHDVATNEGNIRMDGHLPKGLTLVTSDTNMRQAGALSQKHWHPEGINHARTPFSRGLQLYRKAYGEVKEGWQKHTYDIGPVGDCTGLDADWADVDGKGRLVIVKDARVCVFKDYKAWHDQKPQCFDLATLAYGNPIQSPKT